MPTIHHLAQQEPAENAIITLQSYRQRLLDRSLVVYQIVLDLTLARLYFEAGNEKHSQECVSHAIGAAFRDNYIQPFIEEVSWIAPYLLDLRTLAPSFIDRILAFMPTPHTMTFTPREQAIIPLLKRGFTNGEIANSLEISINTVKYHLKNIYKKLEVNNRMQAVQVLTGSDLP